MKNRKTFKALLQMTAAVCIMGLLAGCGSANKHTEVMSIQNTGGAIAEDYYQESSDSVYAEEFGGSGFVEGIDSEAANSNIEKTSASKRKLIKTVNLDVETQQFDLFLQDVETKIAELDGYIENLESYNYNYRNGRRATMVARIPQDKLEDFTKLVTDNANVTKRTESVQDITLEYVDLESKKESLKIEQSRLLELLERADALEDIITLENRLTQVRYQIESMESSLRTFDDKVDYSTVYLTISEVQVLTPVVKDTPMERMIKGFTESFTDVCDGTVEFVIWFVASVPYFVVWIVIIGMIILMIRGMIRKKKAKKAAKALAAKETVPVQTTAGTAAESPAGTAAESPAEAAAKAPSGTSSK